jgi:hypothetical protein
MEYSFGVRTFVAVTVVYASGGDFEGMFRAVIPADVVSGLIAFEFVMQSGKVSRVVIAAGFAVASVAIAVNSLRGGVHNQALLQHFGEEACSSAIE